ncbi:MAG: hypothetical protein K2P53_04930 [Rickettsiales bacterium]|nr:hypothetical protein [Rickettsiales bacterium]
MNKEHGSEITISEEDKQLANLMKAAKNGVPGAKYDLALLHLEGAKVYKDIDKAIDLLKDASEKHPDAAYKLGELYLQGEVIQKNIPKALALFENAAQKDHLKALYQLGSIYKEGINVKKDVDVAIKYLDKASKNGDSNSTYLLGEMYLYDKNDFTKAQNYLIDANKKGNIDATYLLGKLYFKSDFVKTDYKISIKYLNIASGAGHSEATYLLGIYYTEGLEIASKDVTKGLKLLEEASNNGSVDAKYELAKLYLDDNFEKKDSNLGKRWLEKLSNDGHSKAQFMLSKIYFQETDFESGFKWGEKAIKNNHPEAQFYLGKKILSDCEIDPQGVSYFFSLFGASKIYCSKGIDFISKAANILKDPEAALVLAKAYASGMYEKHEVTQINGELEDKYLEMAVLGNLPEALYLSAKKTLEKTNTPSDETKSDAVRKLNFAVDNGNLDAKYYLATLNSSGNEHTKIKLLTEAAEKGHYNSQYQLGKVYFEQSPALNCKKSIFWFLKSMETAKFKASQIIADRYDLDIKVIDEASLKQAYRKIALKTHPDKISSYKNPGKLKEDYEKITKLYKEGYNSKIISSILNDKLHDDVEYSIGQMYHNKRCVDLDINLSTAKEWYDKGASDGHSESQYQAYALHKSGGTATGAKDDSGIDSSDSNIFADQSSNAIDEALGEVNNQDEL